ncbi:MAG: S-layer homology domain-containing protein [Candidatus Saccharibacteria bacterium]|nr:S-layer homology domain-containing protein [Candidatus Saccharibacteria bacterium]
MTRRNNIYNLLKFLGVLSVGFMVMGGGCYLFGNSDDVIAASSSVRRLSGKKKATVDAVSLDEFSSLGLAEKVNAIAELDDVEIACSTEGMKPVLVGGVNVKDGVTDAERVAMFYNSWFLQNIISCAPDNSAIYLPEGTFYFVSGHITMAEGSEVYGAYERHVIKPADNVALIGKGVDENGQNTTLKPYSEAIEFSQNEKLKEYKSALGQSTEGEWGGRIDGGVDMFFFNDYSAYNFTQPNYLTNADFYDFIIDSEDTRGPVYTTAGKGFMINLFKDCDWDNVVVKNTDGTGFGVDAPINGTITNSRAEGCGKAATTNDGGASGFGIGTGYANNESMVISNSVAVNNKKFGFFYEHQSRFNAKDYRATKAANEKAFKVIDSHAEGNLYNYGGLRANDVHYENSSSVASGATVLDIYFSDESRRVAVDGMSTETTVFEDVDTSAWYYEAVKWATENGITNGTDDGRFGVGHNIKRADAVILLWRMYNRQGDVLSLENGNLSQGVNRYPQDVQTCYADVPGDAYYAGAVQWAHEKGIIIGTKDCSSATSKDGMFDPERTVTRAEFVTMLWRLAGSPSAGKVKEFSDVTDKSEYYYKAVYWAAKKNISDGVGDNKFEPDYDCTREQIVTLMYRYSQNK